MFSIFLLIIGFLAVTSANNPRVKTPAGTFEGFVHENRDGSKSHIYLGVRYARAPIGELRFEVK